MSNDLIQKQDVVKEHFGWEVPVEVVPLPSRGMVYGPDSPLHGREMLEIKSMTANEEDILMSPALIKQGKVLNTLLSACLIDKSIDPDELLSGDRNALMVAIRITGYGSDYTVQTTCPNCSARRPQTYDLAELAIKRLILKPVDESGSIFEFDLPVTKKKVYFKFLSGKEEAERSLFIERMKKVTGGSGVDKGVTSKLEYQIVAIDGVTDGNAVRQFISKMPARDSKSLRRYIGEHEPGIDMNVNMKCPECGHQGDVSLPIGASFFWPE